MKAQLLALGAVLATHLVAAETPDVEAQGFPGFPDFPKIPFPGDWYNKFRQLTPEKLIWHIGIKDLMAGAKKLEGIAYATPERNRVFGTKAHNDTVDYLVRELQRTHYYDVVKQKQIHLWSMSNATFKVNGKDTEVTPMTYSPSGQSKADIVLVNNLGCVAEDFPPEVNGKIALILRGDCTFGLKSALAGSAKAVGALIYNNIPGPLSGTLGSPSDPNGPYPPTVGVSKEIGDGLAARAGSETLTGELLAHSEFQNRTTFNVIATSKDGDKNNIIAIGGHTDSVEAGPGINDDGSGIIGNLIIAKALARFKVPNAVRFLFWTAEEYGLLGSQFYVDNLTPQERDKIRLYLNFDMTASPNYANMIYDGDGSTFNVTGPAGSAEIEKLFQKYYEDRKQPHIPTEFDGRSDYDAFISVGIPSGGIFTGAEGIKTEEQAKMFGGTAGIAYDANYHGKGDNVTNINKDAWLLNTKGAAYVLATYARSTKGLPPKDPPPKDENQARSLGRYGGVKPFNGRCDDVHGHGRRCTY
ncbi:aminopeptidase [Histoplasma capsulatum G186AR]|uniref:Peptide hydrolase n=1 Tax=Ajellomyces capsulatus TaxID=5037 RepID=A0A8H7YFU1_AJECA|nr:aminopeptidase [Histoplasma capsulatum]QSS71203.1 aminopeptidase [Histoplasma capsulatum G186AR]